MARHTTTAHGLTMTWSVVLRGQSFYVLRGYIDGEQRFACQMHKHWTREQGEALVIERLKRIAQENAKTTRDNE